MKVSEIVRDYLIGDKQAPVHYVWCNADRVEEPTPVSRKYEIECWSREGRLLKVYPTMQAAADDNGLDVSQVSMNIKLKCRFCKKGTIYFTKRDLV